jgi:hypothetical protein
VPFLSTFDTTANAGSGTIDTGQVGTEESGAILPGTNADDHSGFAVAAAGEVNGDDLADILIGAPNADAGGSVDAGKVTLVFGSVGLQSAGGALDTLEYLGEAAGQRAGSAVARAGDIDGDGVGDFLIGAPGASPHGTGSGRVYLVFGDPGLDDVPVAGLNLADLAACAAPTLCGVAFNGEATGDSAGAAVSAAGDLNHDGHDDLLIAAPGASPGSRVGAGKVYLVYGAPSFPPGVVELSAIATRSLPGHVFHGEGAGDRAGESISSWPDVASAVDDLIIGAPGGDVTEFSSTILDAGYVYAIHGGTTNLCQNPQPCSPAIELSRVANGLPDQVAGVVFLGTEPGGEIGRSVTGEVDVDGDGVPDIIIGADQEAWVIPGDDPKGETTSSPVKKDPDLQPGRLREPGGEDAINRFGAVFFSAGSAGELGGVAVGAAGDVNHDGVGDFILGAPGVDAPGEPDAGAAYLVYGSRFPRSRETLLSDIGVTVPGLAIAGSDGGDQTGRSVGGGSDFNGDGIADALVGAPFADVAATTPTDGGETYVISPVTPDEVVLVKLRKTAPPGTAALEWTVADRAVSYNVYRGLLAQLHLAGPVFTSNMTQLACGIASDADSDGLPDTTDPLVPAAQAGFYYLVTGNNLQGEGPLGPAGATPPRTNDAQCP